MARLGSARGVDYRANPVGSNQAAIRGTNMVELPGRYQRHSKMELPGCYQKHNILELSGRYQRHSENYGSRASPNLRVSVDIAARRVDVAHR